MKKNPSRNTVRSRRAGALDEKGALSSAAAHGATMADVKKMLAALHEERARIEDAILNLEALAEGRGKRRGRPPKWLVEARERQTKATAAPKPRKKK